MSSCDFVHETAKSVTKAGIESKGLVIWPAGTLLFSMYASLGHTAELMVPAATNQAILSLLPRENVNQKFLRRWLEFLKPRLREQSSSNTQDNLNAEKVRNLVTLIPPLEEQIAIAAFLDRETWKTDALIAEQEKLVTLLAEKRQAIISHAVTRGLNPDVPMKDSGVAWLGEVPAHWDVVPIKRVVEVKDGTHATPAYVDPTSESYPLITSKDFVDSDICFDDAKYISSDDHSEIIRRSNTEQGDVLMSMIGGNIGKAVVVKSERKFSIKNLALFKTSHSGSLGKFVLYYLQSGLLDIQIDLIGRGGAQGFLGLGDIRNLVFFKIAEHELQQVVSHLETKLAPLDKLVKLAEKHLLTLKERRAALIAAVVTGQIDVRNAVPEELTA
ncbi:hypothetical protein P350_01380 [Burkholderia cepacia JBK9]|nr:hypothetical protein P350_01380 [Burkholderia cepacia JBK9]